MNNIHRHEFLRRMRRNRTVSVDETWANSHCSHERVWVEHNDKAQDGMVGGLQRPSAGVLYFRQHFDFL